MKKIAATTALTIFVSACVAPRAQYNPYPTQNKNAIEYNRDIAECRSWASNQAGANPQRAMNEGAQGAVVGAVAGTLLGAIFGGRRGAGTGALAGGLIGAGAGGMQGSQRAQVTYDIAYKDCLNKKGY